MRIEKTLADLTRPDFPMLVNQAKPENKLIYLDHAATSQKPTQVIEALSNYYIHNNANVHRGAHQLSARATEEFENARKITSKFINSYSEK